ncbi:MAG TPA: ribosome biogenesis GTPase Der [Anaerolineaceae bacterium]|nr:ribosome biogenesis GTPase Der [Anaerolineaceae bacterium]HPN52739.1 ribosome biogenesis GTPase Der [Anaerolineaceae bacterium]
MNKPVVALVGRPNVGKSTLFNRLAEEPLAIVDTVPGTTRDRLFAEAQWNGVYFDIVDTGGIDPSSGGKAPLSIGSAEFIEQIRNQAILAIQEADAILFVTDASTGVTPADVEVASILRRNQRKLEDGTFWPPIILVVNKADSQTFRNAAAEFYELSMGDPYPISAIHGTGTGDLLDALLATFRAPEQTEEDNSVKIAIVGKPNVGKSSLLNRLVGEERSIVSPIAGTTRDAVDTKFEYEGLPITLIDTAGIRRRGRIDPGVEKYSVLRSMRAIERADVAILMIDATTGITAQDAHIAGYVLEAWKSCVVVVNKWDAIEKDTHTMTNFTKRIREDLNFMDYVPVLFISAKSGQRVDQVMPMALRVQEQRVVRLSTGQLNRILQKAQDKHSGPSHAGRTLRMYYGTQVRADPPTFLIYVNDPTLGHFTFTRYLENCIRAEYPYTGTPIRVVMRPRRE